MGSRRPFATIGMRLSFFGAATTLVVCLILCAVLYLGMRHSLYREVDLFLCSEAGEFRAEIAKNAGDLAAAKEIIQEELRSHPPNVLSFVLFDRRGHALVDARSNGPPAEELWASIDPASLDAPRYETVGADGASGPIRVLLEAFADEQGRRRIARTGYSLTNVEHSLGLLRRLSIAGLAIATLLALLAGWLVARRSLRPVQLMTDAALRIGSSRLDERLPQTGVEDELDRLATTLNGMLDRIERHVNQVRQFTADASHEFKSPLAALRGMAEIALTKPRPAEELRQVLESSIEEYLRLQRLAEDLLVLARADADATKLDKRPTALVDVVRDAFELYAPLADDAGIDVRCGELADVEVLGDGARLRQLVGNLIDNAIKYNRPNGEVELRLERRDGHAALTIRDTGIGVSKADLPRIFDRFYRGDRSRSSQGTGLGLSICQWIVEAHGGTIHVSSEEGVGTEVEVLLPCRVPERPREPTAVIHPSRVSD